MATIVKCDCCDTELPDLGNAQYRIKMECLSGPNTGTLSTYDLCGYCAGQLRYMIEYNVRLASST